jgi:hypothetical protein
MCDQRLRPFRDNSAGDVKMPERRILNSWKEIASYLGRGVRTVQRWEAQLGLPVHRPAGKDHSAVLAFSSELDQWLDSRPVREPMRSDLQAGAARTSQASDMKALLSRAETILQKMDSLLLRTDEMHRKLSDAVDGMLEDRTRRDLRASTRARRIEAGAA